MYGTDKAEIVIDASPEEHYGPEYDTLDNRPCESAPFHQREEVARL
ncbi:hypothetical protein [Halalkalicoccus paucihalophilus]|nr:hypothetical protein [Halalkalicoccus paucihalophilus]